ncbi:Putative transposase [Mycobacterium tuberculosis]|nr:Putative transposase [Mycobacterium tuberculosis]
MPAPGRVELVLAHPSGITEIDTGTYSVTGDVIDVELSSTTIGLAPTAKEVTELGRSVRVAGDDLSYTVRMGAVGQPLQDHLAAVLHRKG